MASHALVDAGVIVGFVGDPGVVLPPGLLIASDVSALTPAPLIGWGAAEAGGAWTYTPPVVPPPPPPTTLTPLGFMSRLTPAEETVIATAAQANAQLLVFLLKLAGAQVVDVTDPLTQAGVAAMVTAGLLTQQRATQILNLAEASP